VAITFDDGTAGQFEHALPALRERGMSATFFVTTDWIGSPGFMSWDQLRELVRSGMSVQSHTKSHPFLSELGEMELRLELAESKRMLDGELKQDTTQLGLPGGNAPRRSLRPILAQVGYKVVAGSRWGVNAEARDIAQGPGPWIRRCTAPTHLSPELARRIVHGDLRIGLGRGIREAVLYGLRGVLGASRYAGWRRRILDTVSSAEPDYADR
jgi:peptidoglycan/xylan/chitin deacetylase (PgdA/CDA1 family)